jgi:hypothetical protein
MYRTATSTHSGITYTPGCSCSLNSLLPCERTLYATFMIDHDGYGSTFRVQYAIERRYIRRRLQYTTPSHCCLALRLRTSTINAFRSRTTVSMRILRLHTHNYIHIKIHVCVCDNAVLVHSVADDISYVRTLWWA